MDPRTHERRRPPLHGLVIRALLVALVATALLAAIAGGLLRAGLGHWLPPLPADAAARAALGHAALMMVGFLGTVIGVERAVALSHGASTAGRTAVFVAPLTSALGTLAWLAGLAAPAQALWLAASLAFVAVNLVVLKRQAAPHTALLLAGALALLAGNGLFALGVDAPLVLPWWFDFLVLTIAAERLEMARLMRPHPAARPLLLLVLAALLVASACTALAPRAAGIGFGAALVALALWLVLFDVARRTVHAAGLSRYMAVCLLAGYAWLAAGGAAWAAMAAGAPTRDLALHAIGLGFVFGMVMAHAPVILPAVTGIRLAWSRAFYAPLALLQVSLLLRLAGGLADDGLRRAGTLLNVAAIVLFALTIAAAAWAWRRAAANAPAAARAARARAAPPAAR
ncbi:hypothetical protein [Aquabacterium humicola]|uniref:hypothetical protein n=1 Tax=Aquabacterium humicola TaxID=3237377 RepID=UPI00254347EC|nr:hypothetical protein [Rubrivivax pictus]